MELFEACRPHTLDHVVVVPVAARRAVAEDNSNNVSELRSWHWVEGPDISERLVLPTQPIRDMGLAQPHSALLLHPLDDSIVARPSLLKSVTRWQSLSRSIVGLSLTPLLSGTRSNVEPVNNHPQANLLHGLHSRDSHPEGAKDLLSDTSLHVAERIASVDSRATVTRGPTGNLTS